MRCFTMRARWGSKVSSPSGAIGHIGRAARRIDVLLINNFNNLHCQNAPYAAVGNVGVSGAVSRKNRVTHRCGFR
jgi:hypothetical protein